MLRNAFLSVPYRNWIILDKDQIDLVDEIVACDGDIRSFEAVGYTLFSTLFSDTVKKLLLSRLPRQYNTNSKQ
jgi:hypothetical protein